MQRAGALNEIHFADGIDTPDRVAFGLTARGTSDRGLVRAGMFADLAIFDANRVIDRSTYSEPFQYCEGIQYVIVNGEVVIDQNAHTLARPGRALRHRETGVLKQK